MNLCSVSLFLCFSLSLSARRHFSNPVDRYELLSWILFPVSFHLVYLFACLGVEGGGGGGGGEGGWFQLLVMRRLHMSKIV